MRKSTLLSIASAVILCTLPGYAAQITFTENIVGSEPDALGSFTIIDATGVATSISGFPSLAGISPSELTFKTHLKQRFLTFDFATGDLYVELGLDPAVGYTTQFFLDGLLVGSSSNSLFIAQGNLFNLNVSAHSVGESLDLIAPPANPFYNDVLALTGGRGTFEIAFDPFTPALETGAFEVTGTITTVTPEPGTLAMLSLATGLFACSRLRKSSRIDARS